MSSATSANSQPGGATPSSHPAPRGGVLSEALLALLAQHGVAVEPIDPRIVRFAAVPVSADFSKPRTNLLLQRLTANGGSMAYVDGDLVYQGPQPSLRAVLSGPLHRNWRRLRVAPVRGSTAHSLCSVLALLGSPIAAEASAALGEGPIAPCDAAPSDLGPVLASAAEAITPEAAAEAYESCLHQELATRAAAIVTRATQPNSAVFWAPSGAGRDHLLLAAAHALLDAGHAERVLRLAGGSLAAGCVFQAEVDSVLLQVLKEAAELDGCLLLLSDLDVCLSGTPASHSLLCQAMDRGLRFLATTRTEAALARLGTDDAFARRFVALRVPPPAPEDVAQALERLAASHAVAAAPEVVRLAMNLAPMQGAAEPAASLGLLGAAIADALWRGESEVHPDDLLAALRSEWPEDTSKE